MEKIKLTYGQYLKSMQILHLAMMMAQLILIVIIFVLVNEESTVIDINLQNTLLIAVPGGVLVIIFSGRFFYQQFLKRLNQKQTLSEKLIGYRTLQIIQYAFCEMAALACFLSSFLSQNTVFVYGAIGVLLYFLSIRPGKTKLEKEVVFDFNEQNKLADPHFIVQEYDRSDAD